MTFSIVARSGDAYGVAVASKFLAIGAVVPGARLGVGAVATQSFIRTRYIGELLDAMAEGADPQVALDTATASDADRGIRQVGVVGAQGAATFTGEGCYPWAGARTGVGDDSAYAIQGNMLTGDVVVEEMRRAWLASDGEPFARRLVVALMAGDAAGGDSRGRQSAALLAVRPGAGYDGNGVLADLRVDDHPDASGELARLQDLHELYFGAPEGPRPLKGALRKEVHGFLRALGVEGTNTEAALVRWMGGANLETRHVSGGIDARVLEELRRAAGT